LSTGTSDRGELLAALGRVARLYSTQTVLYTQAIADRLGVNLTELVCMGVLSITGPITAGRLAQLTGLTTGAITGVVDRLVKVGYVTRAQDPADRRRVIIEPRQQAGIEIAPLFMPMLQKVSEAVDSYDDRELAAIVDYVINGSNILREETARLRGGPAPVEGPLLPSHAPIPLAGDPAPLARTPDEVDRVFSAAISAGDLDTALALYEPEARYVHRSGRTETGHAAIRQILRDLIAAGPTLVCHEISAVESGATAVVQSHWTVRQPQQDGGVAEHSGRSFEVVRRGADGGWRFVIDMPYGAETGAQTE
jgi:DNA-binding MarR family transcriptional regulator/ketosteroid isomerase-like protein